MNSDFFFFNNPFGETIMQIAIDNILLSIDRKWREVVLLYINPEQRAVIDKTMAFDTIDEGYDYVVYSNRRPGARNKS